MEMKEEILKRKKKTRVIDIYIIIIKRC